MKFGFKGNYEKENDSGAQGTQCLVLCIPWLDLEQHKRGG